MREETGVVEYQAALEDIKQIITSGQKYAYQAANKAMVFTYWQIGKRIVEQEQKGEERATYGKALLDTLSAELTREYGKSYSKRNLQYFRKFYFAFPDEQIVNTCAVSYTHLGLDTINSNGSSSQCCGLSSVSSQAISNLSNPTSCRNILIRHKL